MANPDDLRILFERAQNLPEAARDRWIATLAPEQQQELSELLGHAGPGRHYFKDLTGFLFGDEPAADGSDDPLDLIGKPIGGYTVTELLGQGGMGVVYKAYDPTLNRPVAIKLLAPGQHLADDARNRFLAEAQMVSRLDHTAIGTLYGHSVTDDGLDALVMAFYDGQTLQELMEHQQLDGQALVGWMVTVLEGLRYAHQEGVVHKDIKPANLMVLGPDQIKILDFGAAAYLEQEVENTAIPIGTTAYMSPEQIRGEALTGATDFWSLGVVLFEASVRLGWLDDVNAFTWAQNPAASTKRAPAAVERLLKALLVVDPERRLAAVAALDLSELDSAAHQIKATLTGKTAKTVALTSAMLAAAAIAWQALKPAALPLPEHRKLALVYNLSDGLDTALAGELTERLKSLAYEQGNISFVGEYGFLEEGGQGGADGIDPAGANLTWNLVVTDESDDPALGDNVQVSLTLADALSGEPLSQWQQRYPKGRMDLVPADLYQHILSALKVQPSGLASLQNQESITDPKSYGLYLEAKAKMARYQQSGDTDDAPLLEEAKQSLLEANRLSPQASYQLALAQVFTKQYEMLERPEQMSDAIYWANKALETNPQLIPAYLALAELYGLKAEYGTAIASYRLALQQQPSNIDALQGLAVAYRSAGRFDEADDTLNQAMQLAPENWRSHSLLGTVDHFQGKLDAAVAHYNEALSYSPNNRLVLSNMAVANINLEAYDQVIASYAGTDENELDGYEKLNLALAYFYSQDFSQAERVYQLVVKDFPERHGIWAQLGLTQRLNNGAEHTSSQASFETARHLALEKLRDSGNEVSLLCNIASYNSWLNRHDEALEMLDKTFELWNEDYTVASEISLDQLFSTAVTVYENAGHRDKALQALQSGIDAGYTAHSLMKMPVLLDLKRDNRFQQILGQLAQGN
ncbi:serine/threonine-protein kinase [Ferrimonas balearica]|uniref:serine/threonine-protein kinase n=1 Tax=Ferrimonas balearica TaxID=44012 RepID=UPI001C993191|nr:serine/threonine-protein kinase [Ferrimonas balearica]MBY5991530.1 protein kinase [Ferrimonas balearica]